MNNSSTTIAPQKWPQNHSNIKFQCPHPSPSAAHAFHNHANGHYSSSSGSTPFHIFRWRWRHLNRARIFSRKDNFFRLHPFFCSPAQWFQRSLFCGKLLFPSFFLKKKKGFSSHVCSKWVAKNEYTAQDVLISLFFLKFERKKTSHT